MTPAILRLAATAAALALLTACGSDPAQPPAPAAAKPLASPTQAAEPRTVEAAKAAAQRTFDRFGAGDFAGMWDLMSSTGKRAISRADYVKLNETCSQTGLPLEVTDARPESDGHVVVVVKVMGATQSYGVSYEQGRWLVEPTKESLASYAKGVDKAIADRKAAGSCQG